MAAKAARFQTAVSNGEHGSISLALYPKIKAPSSKVTSAPKPAFVSTVEMKSLLRTKHGTMGHVWGLTIGTFSLRFPDLAKQWTRNSDGRWQFQGGDVQLAVTNNIYIDGELVSSSARLDSAVVGLIMTHELLHVQDNIEIATQDGPLDIAGDEIVKYLLIDAGKGEPAVVEEREYTHWMVDQTKDADGNTCSYLSARVVDLLVDKLNAKAATRDSGPAYADYGNEISRTLQNPNRR